MSVEVGAPQRRQPERRPLDRPGLRLRVGEHRDRSALDDERQRRAAEQDEQERGAEGDQRRPGWRRSAPKTGADDLADVAGEHLLDVGAEQQHDEEDAADDRHRRAAA